MYATNFLGIRPKTQTKVADGFQIFDLLQLSRKEREAKELCLERLQDIRDWEGILPGSVNSLIAPSLRIHSATLRREAHEAIRVYRLIRESRIRLFKDYMDELPPVGTSKRLAS